MINTWAVMGRCLCLLLFFIKLSLPHPPTLITDKVLPFVNTSMKVFAKDSRVFCNKQTTDKNLGFYKNVNLNVLFPEIVWLTLLCIVYAMPYICKTGKHGFWDARLTAGTSPYDCTDFIIWMPIG